MATFLCTWNPKLFEWGDLEHEIEMLRTGGGGQDRWTVGRSKQIRKGDRIFLLRQGKDKPGIVGSGMAVSDVYEDVHWQDPSQTRNYVNIRWDALFDPEKDAILPRTRLDEGILRDMHWNTQMSGIRIPDPIAEELERVWASFQTENVGGFSEASSLPPTLFSVEPDYEYQLTLLADDTEEFVTLEQQEGLVLEMPDGTKHTLRLTEIFLDSEEILEAHDQTLGEFRLELSYEEDDIEDETLTIPSTDEYRSALERMELSPEEQRLLSVFYQFPNHTASAGQLAEKLGMKEYIVANGAYGRLGKRLTKELGVELGRRFAVSILATFILPGEQGNKHVLWVMRPELAGATESLLKP